MDLKYKKLFAIQFAKVSYLVPVAVYCTISKYDKVMGKPVFMIIFN